MDISEEDLSYIEAALKQIKAALKQLKAENEEQCKIIQCKTGTILSLAKIRDELKAENEKLKQQLKQQQYKRELDYGQGYKMYATEKGVFIE